MLRADAEDPRPVAVVGGGPAGSTAAAVLAALGVRVVLFEREAAALPKVCGEFVSAEACAALAARGVDVTALGAAPVRRLRVAWGRTVVDTALPFVAASLTRASLDGALLSRAARAGAEVRMRARVVDVRPDGSGGAMVVAREGGPDGRTTEVDARAVVLASGKWDLPGVRRGGAHRTGDLGFKTYLRLQPGAYDALAGAVELTLFAGGYAGMQHVQDGATAFSLVVRREAYAHAGDWTALVRAIAWSSPRLASRLHGASEERAKPLAIAGVPYGFVFDGPDDGCYRVGDQLAVIPSFTGDGIAIALESGARAAAAIAAGVRASAYHASMRAALRRPMALAGALSRAIGSPAGRRAVVWPARVAPVLFRIVAAQTRIARPPA